MNFFETEIEESLMKTTKKNVENLEKKECYNPHLMFDWLIPTIVGKSS